VVTCFVIGFYNPHSAELARLTTPQEVLAGARNSDTTKVGVLVAGYARSIEPVIKEYIINRNRHLN
jgi:hypothetical protein